MWFLLLLATVAFAIACAGTRLALGVLIRGAILDQPNDRSSHSVPTPRGGGLAVVAALALVWIGWMAATDADPVQWGVPLLGCIALAVISFIDDLRSLPAALRLGAHTVAITAGLWALDWNGALAAFLPREADIALTVLAWLWFVNLYNFMDGIDGIVGSETIAIGVGLIVLALLGLAPINAITPAVIVAAATAGFLIWNWHPARIFLGDAGSVSLGYIVGFLLIAAAASDSGDGRALAGAFLLPLVFSIDATVTLLRRLARGKKPTEAHREHAYQRAVQGGWSHARVCLAIAATNTVLILAAALVVAVGPLVPLAIGLAVTGLAVRGLARIGSGAHRVVP